MKLFAWVFVAVGVLVFKVIAVQTAFFNIVEVRVNSDGLVRVQSPDSSVYIFDGTTTLGKNQLATVLAAKTGGFQIKFERATSPACCGNWYMVTDAWIR